MGTSTATRPAAPDGPPDAVKLLPVIDPDRLRADLAAVEKHFLVHANPAAEDAERPEGEQTGWDVLVLRCPGGDLEKIGRNAGGLQDFADTSYLGLTPYVREILDSMDVPIRGVRFSSLAAGAEVQEHTDSPYGLPVGWVRLHIPVETSDAAVLTINGADQRWKPSEFWYANFGMPHSLYNRGSAARVHLIIDCYVAPGLFDLFPADVRAQIAADEVMFFREERALPDQLRTVHGTIRMPAAFLKPHPELPTAEEWDSGEDAEGELRVQDDRLVLRMGEHETALAHIGDREFRPLCWTHEQSMVLDPAGPAPRIVFRYRRGSQVIETVREQPALES
ncbi:aspartyl/asparaginyl beta-hydroxylase domain-containing protein [Amycolatopsis circi]|uniref:aspartyl/asparaginyl beta-hydroxylase domain-containing protein n=1 Tax=Amycolatopsis circi TaxID=871959 RepID=UPI0013BE9C6A|nr:aspartyl/asparaginyl beta-hydroxylase domain-containing protein [Amycolatopsis circi]